MCKHQYKYIEDGDIGSGWFCIFCGKRKDTRKYE